MTLFQFVRELLKAFLIGTGLFVVYALIEFIKGNPLVFDRQLLIYFGYSQMYAVSIYMANVGLVVYMLSKYRGKLHSFWVFIRWVVYSLLTTVVVMFLISIGIPMLNSGMSFSDAVGKLDFYTYWPFILMALLIFGAFYAFYYHRNSQDKKIKTQKIIADAASAKFDVLKNQLDPHFLFNSLNVLSSLIEEDPRKAQRFTYSLSNIYRYILEQKNKILVSLDQELEFANTYIDLLEMRFEESIVFSIPEKASTPKAKVVPLSLQLVLENAVKHNKVSPNKPLQITVKEIDNNLIISNNLQPRQVLKSSSGFGLQNIKQRYAMLSKRTVSIKKTTSQFVVCIPILTKQLSAEKIQATQVENKRYLNAKERMEAMKSFYGHLITFCLIIPVLWGINLANSSFIWAVFPTLGWGLGLFSHWIKVTGNHPFFNKNWQQKKIKQLMEDKNF